MKPLLFYILSMILLLSACKTDQQKSKSFQIEPESIVNVKNKIKDIKNDLLLTYGGFSALDSIIFYNESNPKNQQGIHLFNRNNLKYIKSTGTIGRGPGEITRLGANSIDQEKDIIWVSDYAKQVRWKFSIDSVLKSKNYLPEEKIKLPKDYFLRCYEYLNDSIGVGMAIKPLDHHTMEMEVAKINLENNNSEKFGYVHPDIKEKETYSKLKLAKDRNVYIRAHTYIDLLTICDTNGKLICNVYGPNWKDNIDFKENYYFDVQTFGKYIIASYLGKKRIIKEEGQKPNPLHPKKLLFFDFKGNYVKTIDTGHQFSSFFADNKMDRIILYFEDRQNSLGYFNLSPDSL